MVKRGFKVGAVAGLLTIGLLAASNSASAQTGDTTPSTTRMHVAPLSGTIVSVGAGSFQLQTQTGLVTVAYTAKTHVTLIKSGTTADLKANNRVDVHLANGAIDTAQVSTPEPARVKPTTTSTHATHAKSGTWTNPTGTTAKTHPTTGAATHLSGKIVSFNAGTNALTISHGRTSTATTYTLAAGVTIKVESAGTSANLLQGASVRVMAPSNSATVAITILNA